jgi:hypothetical protein
MTAATSSSKSCQADQGAIDDETVSESCALEELVLRAKILPAGEVHITMRPDMLSVLRAQPRRAAGEIRTPDEVRNGDYDLV